MGSDTLPAKANKGLWFSLLIEGEEFVAFLSDEALNDRFNATTPGRQRLAYRLHREYIDSIARRKFATGFPRPIRLVAADFDEVRTHASSLHP
ncbi:MAG: DUF1488 family protein [Noviherbaspirillum sp.]